MIHHMPLFWYDGNRYVPSDKPFIEKHLQRLSAENQRIACENYDELYKCNVNAKKYREARKEANTYLKEFADKNAIRGAASSRNTNRNPNPKGLDQRKNAMIERARAAQKASRPSIF